MTVPGKGGRPKAEVNDRLLRRLAMIQCTWDEMAAVCEVSTATLQRRFTEVVHQGWKAGRASLRREQWKKAITEKNTTMLIFLGKQYLGQSDKPNEPQIDAHELARQIRKAVSKMDAATGVRDDEE